MKYRISRDKVVRIAELVIVEAENESEAIKAAEDGKGSVETDGGKVETYDVDHATPICKECDDELPDDVEPGDSCDCGWTVPEETSE